MSTGTGAANGAGYEVRLFDCCGDEERRTPGFVEDLPFEVCLVSRGCFWLRASRATVLVDPTTVLLGGPGDTDFEVRHPHPGGDKDTFIRLSATYVAALAGGDIDLPALALTVTPAVELAHRRLVAVHRCLPGSPLEEECASDLTTMVFAAAEPLRALDGWTLTRRRARRLVEDARSILVDDPNRSLVEVAAAVGCSPYHLSRIFHRETGLGVAGYRISLRVQRALDGLTEGAPSLADLAAHCGFYDHAHLTRTLTERFGLTPSAIRASWSQLS